MAMQMNQRRKLLVVGAAVTILVSYVAYDLMQGNCPYLGYGNGSCGSMIPGMQTLYDADDVTGVNNRFAMSLYSELREEEGGNMFFSPASIMAAFAMVYEGAEGDTADEMRDAFGFSHDNSKHRSSFRSMIGDMNEDGNAKYELRIANALWLAKGFEPHGEYAYIARDFYGSQVASVDFGSAGFDLINDWVEEKTAGRIAEMFPPEAANPQTALAITNAIYFKGMWAEPFDAEKTKMDNFYTGQGTSIRVPLMEIESAFLNLARTDTARMAELPYDGDRISMLILLPEETDGLESLEESMTADNLEKWVENLQKTKARVWLPRFQMETAYDMVSPLQDLGIRDVFGANADLSGISDSGLFIDKAVHRALVDVNEEGTEAAAATGAVMFTSGPTEFRVDRPFVFVIRDMETGQILFMGRVSDPTV